MADARWQPMRAIGTYTRRSDTGTLIETYHDGYEVNGTGAFIWSLVGTGATTGQIAAAVAGEFGVAPERADEAVTAFLSLLGERGFLAPA
ncbi:PqqD family protein [Streptomyces sp. SL13]|uniref:PqqD family protein n=1 Tax=Streptantibioticus silvisoli TaxID=2705255 RepID=A0AA90H5S8_9ACTN|nr:PqqD family protein [Streptantibioticus silvisoli]MDI5962175.1 PqqD family protein [Streptantibioticus silvisoli]MDI5972441.1 PqqD family protein [Streptantibioticus silvisoli]